MVSITSPEALVETRFLVAQETTADREIVDRLVRGTKHAT